MPRSRRFELCLTEWPGHDGFAEVVLEVNGRMVANTVIGPEAPMFPDAFRVMMAALLDEVRRRC